MNILVTGANGQLGNEMRIVTKGSSDKYIFTDVNQVEGLETTYLDITDIDAIRTIVADNDIKAIVNCAAWTNVDACENDEKLAALAASLSPCGYSNCLGSIAAAGGVIRIVSFASFLYPPFIAPERGYTYYIGEFPFAPASR